MPDARYTTELRRQEGKGGLHYIEVPASIAESLFQKFPARALLTIHQASFHGGVLRRRDGWYLVQMGKATVKKIKASLHQVLEVHIAVDTTELGYEIAEELLAVLEQDDEGRKQWEMLSDGQKRSFLHFVNSAKSVDVRIKRAFHILKRAGEVNAEKARKAVAKKQDPD